MMDETRAKLAYKWSAMISRCHNPSDPGYKNYGGRGIHVCERWHEFESFFSDISPCPEGLSLDRKDNNRGYSPDNCEWADAKTQCNNRRSNIPITCNGETKNLQAWADESGIGPDTIKYRIDQGWEPKDAIFAPVYAQRNNNVIIDHEGRKGTVKQWEEWTGIPHAVIRTRICEHGWPVERAISEPVGIYFGGKRGGPRHDNVNLTVNGETRTLAEWSRVVGVPQSTIRNRVRSGRTPEAAVMNKKTLGKLTVEG